MKKLIYITAVPQSLESFLLPRLKWLEKEYEVTGICSPGEECDRIRQGGMKLIETPIARHISPLQDLKSLWRLWRILKREKPDMVHSMTPKAGLLGMTAAFFAGVPVRIHTFTGLIFPWKTGKIRQVLKTTDRLTCLFATVVNPEGEGVKRQLREANVTRKELTVIAHGNINGVDLTRFVPGKGREEKRAELGYAENHVVFSFVGRLVKDKGIPELVASFLRLHRDFPDARLLLVGREEPELDPLPRETKERMASCDAILRVGPRYDVERWLAASDIYILPSHREGFCNSLLEAGAMALPGITYDICGCNDSINASTGILVPPYDEEELYRAMRRLYENPEGRASLGRAARKHIRDKFDREHVWLELQRFYARLSAGLPSKNIPNKP